PASKLVKGKAVKGAVGRLSVLTSPDLGSRLGLLGRFLLGGCGGMIRNRFHCAFIHRLGLRLSEARPWGNNPVLGLLAAARTGARLDAAGIDSLFGLASGKIGLDVHGALTREVLAPFELIRIGKAHDYELGV